MRVTPPTGVIAKKKKKLKKVTPADLDAYFARTGYTGPRDARLSSLHSIINAQSRSIPFENIDVLVGRPISLDSDAVFQKLVVRARGGYCFEQNSLLMRVLVALGFSVTPLSARVRWQRPREVTPPRTHLFLLVEVDGAKWLADVGIGGVSLTSAIPLDTSGARLPTPHEPRRIVKEAGSLFHQVLLSGDVWADVCEFTMEAMPMIDCELANWYTSTHPNSHFRNRLVVARAAPEGGRVTLLNRELTVRRGDGEVQKRTIDTPEELLAVLADEFGLVFEEGTRFGPPGSPWPA
jgi:N-hydroxyarylamine O-acetyltransferase